MTQDDIDNLRRRFASNAHYELFSPYEILKIYRLSKDLYRDLLDHLEDKAIQFSVQNGEKYYRIETIKKVINSIELNLINENDTCLDGRYIPTWDDKLLHKYRHALDIETFTLDDIAYISNLSFKNIRDALTGSNINYIVMKSGVITKHTRISKKESIKLIKRIESKLKKHGKVKVKK